MGLLPYVRKVDTDAFSRRLAEWKVVDGRYARQKAAKAKCPKADDRVVVPKSPP
jgi:hypothetical protein